MDDHRRALSRANVLGDVGELLPADGARWHLDQIRRRGKLILGALERGQHIFTTHRWLVAGD
jgi:hypothetical protein